MYVIPRYRRKFTEIMLNDYRSDKENIAKRVSTLSDLEESSDISTAESFLEFCRNSDSEKFLNDLKSLVYSQYHPFYYGSSFSNKETASFFMISNDRGMTWETVGGGQSVSFEISQNVYDDVGALQENNLLHDSGYTLTVTGLSVPVVFSVSQKHEMFLSAYGMWAPLPADVQLYGNCKVALFEYGSSVVFTWDFYGVGYSYVFSQGVVSYTAAPETLYLDENGNLMWRIVNENMPDMIQCGRLSAAIAYDDIFTICGTADIINGRIHLVEETESLTVSDGYDLQKEFEELYAGTSEIHSIEDVFKRNRRRLIEK